MKSCVITVSPGMGSETFTYLSERVHARFGEDLHITRVDDADVIGGFYMELDGTVYDMTVKTRLEQAKRAFDGGKAVDG